MELLNEGGGFDSIIEFDYNLGEFIEVEYVTAEQEPLPFCRKSTRFPQLHNFSHLVAFLQKVTEDINKLSFNLQLNSNLSPEQTRALQELSSINTQTVKPSNKGGNVVLMGSAQYKRMCLDLLRNKDWYRAVPVSFNIRLQAQF